MFQVGGDCLKNNSIWHSSTNPITNEIPDIMSYFWEHHFLRTSLRANQKGHLQKKIVIMLFLEKEPDIT